MGTRSYRAAHGAYANFAGVTGAIAALWMVAVWRAGVPWQPVFVPVAGFVVVAAWLAGFRLTIGGSQIAYARLFCRERRCALKEILTVELADDVRPLGATLVIRLASGEGLRLNAKIFPREAMQHLLALGRKTPQRSGL